MSKLERKIEVQIFCRRPTLSEMQSLFSLGLSHVGWGISERDGEALDLSIAIAEQARAAGVLSTLLIDGPAHAIETLARAVRPDFVLVPVS